MTERNAGSARFARFSVFELDLREGKLRKRGVRVRLQQQPLQVLRLLLDHAGEVVSRDDLRRALWPADTYVDFEHNLNSAVKRLRAALDDSATTPRFVETVPRVGYRFLAPVALEAEPPRATSAAVVEPGVAAVGDAPSGARHSSYRAIWSAIAVALAAVVAVLGWVLAGTSPPVTAHASLIRSLAVLPLDNLSNDPEQAYFVDGLTEALIDRLARIQDLKVISRTSVMTYRGHQRRLPEIARELGVDAVVEGSVLRAGDEVRVAVQLIDGRTDQHLWTQTDDGRLRDVLSLQSRVAQAIAREIKVHVSSPEEARLANAPEVDPAAHEAYLKGRYFWNLRTPEGLDQAIRYFDTALEHDPRNAQALAGLADAYNLLPRYGRSSTRASLLLAKENALAALEEDPQSAEAYAALAKVQHSLDWNWDGAERSFRRAIDLSPGYATAHHWYSVFLLTVGRVDEGVTEALRARDLDPLSRVINLHLAWSRYLAGRPDEALGDVRRTLEIAPRYGAAHGLLGWIHLRQGAVEEGRRALLTAIELSGDQPEHLAALAVADALDGRSADARRRMERLRSSVSDPEGSAQPLVWIHVALGETDQAVRLVEQDFANRSVCFYLFHLRLHPLFAPLRSDLRLQALFEGAGLALAADTTQS